MTTRFLSSAFATCALALAVTASQAQNAPTVFPVPITSSIAGLGSAASSTCSANLLATDGVNYGDGCTGTLARLSSPQGAAVDKFGNVYIADYSDRLVRVIYNGNGTDAVGNAIKLANSGYGISSTRNAPATMPVAGNIYTIAGVGASLTLATVNETTTPYTFVAGFTNTMPDGKTPCANYVTTAQPEAIDTIGDGCPGAASAVGARQVTVDGDGNLIITDYTNNRIRILCINCSTTAKATALIQVANPGVTPQNGYIYTVAGYSIGYRDQYPGFLNPTTAETTVSLFRSPSGAAVSSADDIYVADNLNNALRVVYNGGTAANNILTAEGYTPQLGYVYTIAGNDCIGAATTKLGTTTSANSCTVLTGTDVATLANKAGATQTSATTGVGISTAWAVYVDANGNVYYSDAGNGRIKVIYGGIAAPLTLPNTTYPTLQAGFTYSFAGQGTLSASGIAPSLEKLTSAQGVGGDSNGNIFFIDFGTGLFYETYARTGITAIIGGGAGTASPAAGAHCNGGTTGPTMTDAYFNGCPATQGTFASPRGSLVADASGNLYFGDSVGYFLRKFSYNNTFPTEPTGTPSSSQTLAFTSAALVGTGAVNEGSATGADFSDAGGDTCPTTVAGTTCVVNVIFKPSAPGFLSGSASTVLATVTQGYSLLSGTGTGAALTVDPGTATTTGTALVPNAIAVDGAGRVYVADTTTKSIIRYAAGTPTTVATGFTAPAGVAVDGVGNIFVADSTAVKEVSVLGPTTPVTLIAGLSTPHGLATDTAGNLYIADTGNNRIIESPANLPVGTITPIAFTGLTAPQDVAIDLSGNLYAIDGSHIVKLTPAGTQTTVASAGGTAMAVDAAGNVFATSGTTLTEYPVTGASVALYTTLTTPKGLALDGTGNAYVADNSFTGYYELARTAGYYKFTTNPGTTALYATSAGTASVASTAFTASETVDYSVAAATSNGCSGALAAGTNCALTAKYNSTSACVTPDTVLFTSPVTNGAPGYTLTSSSVAACMYVTALPATITYGATETLTATITGTTSIGGTVIFYNGPTQLASVLVGNSGTATYSYTPAVGTYSSITATFTPAGGTAVTLTAAPTSFTVNPATPSISLTVSPTAGYTTTTYTLTATVTATYGTPAGSVSFANGATSLGSAQLSGNTATLMVSTLPAGSDCISATYIANGNYTTVTTSSCSPVSVAAGFAVVASSTALAFPSASYQEAQAFLTITPGGRTDTLSFACNGLPAKLSCSFSPATLALSGLSATQTIQMLVSNSGAKASNSEAPLTFGHGIALASLPFAALLLFGLRRRKVPVALLLALITLIGAAGISGCGNSPVALEQSGGTYPFTVTVSNGTTVLQTINFTITVP